MRQALLAIIGSIAHSIGCGVFTCQPQGTKYMPI